MDQRNKSTHGYEACALISLSRSSAYGKRYAGCGWWNVTCTPPLLKFITNIFMQFMAMNFSDWRQLLLNYEIFKIIWPLWVVARGGRGPDPQKVGKSTNMQLGHSMPNCNNQMFTPFLYRVIILNSSPSKLHCKLCNGQ